MEAVTESRKVWLEENSFHSPYNEQQIVESLAQMCFIALKEIIKQKQTRTEAEKAKVVPTNGDSRATTFFLGMFLILDAPAYQVVALSLVHSFL